MALIAALWRAMEKRRPRGFEAVSRRQALLKDIDIVSLTKPGAVFVSDIPSSTNAEGAFMPASRLYLPRGVNAARLLVYFHGGGYVVGSLDSVDSFCRLLCHKSGMAVLSVDYRLAPENPYPAALEDARAVWQWLQESRSPSATLISESDGRLQLPQKLPLLVAGDSAGAHLCISLCLSLRDAGLPLPAGQILLYPVTNMASFDTPAYEQFGSGYILETKDMEWFRSCYLPDTSLWSHPLLSPLVSADPAGLPPALVLTSEFDILRDEGEAWAGRMHQAGVPVVACRMPGVIHGFATMTAVGRSAHKTIKLICGFMDWIGA